MFQTFRNAWKIPELKNRLLFTLAILVVYRLGCAIPVPFVSSTALTQMFASNGDMLSYLNMMSGGALARCTLFALGVTPYINASIIVQLLTVAIPALENMAKEADGQQKLQQINRYAGAVVALIMSIGYYFVIRNMGALKYVSGGAGIFAAILIFVLYFFYKGYKNGLIVKLYKLLFYIPVAKKYAHKFYDKNVESMEQVDRNIAYLHAQPKAFYTSLLYEYLARVINSLEFYFILLAFGAPVTFVDAILVLAFSSLMGNILFFFPMQMGAREGGLAIIIKILGYPGGLGLGVFSSFFTRIRELVWIFIGVGLVKIGNKKIMK